DVSKIICQRIVGLTAPLAASLLALPSAAQTTPRSAEVTQTAAPTTIDQLFEAEATAAAAVPTAAPTAVPTTTEPGPSLPRLLQDVKPIATPNLLERLTTRSTTAPRALEQRSPEQPSPEFLSSFLRSQPDRKLVTKPDLADPWAFPVPAPPPNDAPVESVEQPVELVLSLAERQLYVYRGDTLETTFPVAVGKPGWETPTGRFEVSHMLENPGWTNPFTDEVVSPGPENPLGERWIAFWTDGEYQIGFHGTPNRESVGEAASHGCVRLYNEHVRELYDLVNPGTLVTVLP
ncbi:MAG: L,D-transpeptidase, partial [Cyanobacteria bacterium P01_G01_bin.38]